MNAIDILRQGALQGASDIHIVPDCPPLFRIHGQLMPLLGVAAFTAEQAKNVILQLLTEPQKVRLTQDFCVDFSMTTETIRYRGNALFQRNGLEVVLRLIPLHIPSPDDLMLPPIVTEVANLKGGLILVTGSTGAGKSTTVACLLDLINQRRHGNIITIEDPIEFIFPNKNCVVSQREIGVHAVSFSSALRAVMRQDPDVVMVGEMRDLETISAAITMAETGTLVLATLHAVDAPQAIDRIIDVFPDQQQQQIRTQVAGVLRAVIAQTLLLKAGGGGRVAMREIMLVNPAISNIIRTGRTHEIYSVMEMSAREGMVSSSRAMSDLVKRGLVDAPALQARPAGQDALLPKPNPAR